jgi:hypothetical protein
MTRIDEIAPDVYRISTFVPEIDLQFSQFRRRAVAARLPVEGGLDGVA